MSYNIKHIAVAAIKVHATLDISQPSARRTSWRCTEDCGTLEALRLFSRKRDLKVVQIRGGTKKFPELLKKLFKVFVQFGARGTTLQTGRSRVRFPMVSLEFFSDIILPVALWPWGRPSL